MDNTLNDVRTILAHVLHVAPQEVGPQAAIRGLPNVDSAAILQAVIAIEDHFGLEFPDELVFRLETVADVTEVIDHLRQQPRAQALPG